MLFQLDELTSKYPDLTLDDACDLAPLNGSIFDESKMD